MTVKTIPYWQQGSAWGEPGHEPWQKLPYPTNPKGTWGWWNDPGVTDEDIWRGSPERKAGEELMRKLDTENIVERMAGMFMPGSLGVEGFQVPRWPKMEKKEQNPNDYLM